MPEWLASYDFQTERLNVAVVFCVFHAREQLNNRLRARVRALGKDYSAVAGRPFATFFCPILFRDEHVELCKAHLINDAFLGSANTATVQRKDVDNFYGAHFEADFISIQHLETCTGHECLIDKRATASLRPEIYLKGQKVPHYPVRGRIASGHTRLVLETKIGSAELALKMNVDQVSTYAPEDWEIVIQKDLRLPALVSLIKAAHLTLFHLLGYRYVLSAGGNFVGRNILGKFLDENQALCKEDIQNNAWSHFSEFKNMVRPVLASGPFDCTVVDRKLLICEWSGHRWAFIVFVRTGKLVNAVLIPIFEQVDGVSRFLSFLKIRNARIEARFALAKEECFSAAPDLVSLVWPEVDLA